jgi:TonB family protein
MKNLLLLAILGALFLPLQAQEKDSITETTIYELGHPEIFPRFPGGEKNLYSFLKNKLIYPEHEKELNIEGTVLVRFEIDELGKIGQLEILKSKTPNFSKEALRLVNLMPNWEPGTIYNLPAKMKMILPINFQITDNQHDTKYLIPDFIPVKN